MSASIAPAHIALLDDHPLFRQGLRYILAPLPYVAEVTETATFDELLAVCRCRLPDLLFLDLQMPGIDGMQVAHLLLDEFSELKIIVLSMFSADKYISQMMRLGARSYLPKDVPQDELLFALQQVLATGYHFTPRISRALTRDLQQPTRAWPKMLAETVQLTTREQEVLHLICEGCTAAEIAERLVISRRTVEGHWHRLLEKTGTPNAVSLAVFAARHHLLHDAPGH